MTGVSIVGGHRTEAPRVLLVEGDARVLLTEVKLSLRLVLWRQFHHADVPELATKLRALADALEAA
jgi:hypothetical protein